MSAVLFHEMLKKEPAIFSTLY